MLDCLIEFFEGLDFLVTFLAMKKVTPPLGGGGKIMIQTNYHNHSFLL